MLIIMIMLSNHDFQPSFSTGYNLDKSRTSENGDDANAKAPVHKHFYVHSHIGRFCQLSALGGSQDTC